MPHLTGRSPLPVNSNRKRCRVFDSALALVIHHHFRILCSNDLHGKVSTDIGGLELDQPVCTRVVCFPNCALDTFEAFLKQARIPGQAGSSRASEAFLSS